MEKQDEHFIEVGRRFQVFERRYLGCREGHDLNNVPCLTEAIQEADRILDLVRQYRLGNEGIIKSQTTMYLADSLNRRADCYFWEGNIHSESRTKYYRLAVNDYKRVALLREEHKVSVLVSTAWLCECYLELKMFDEAITVAEAQCSGSNYYDDYLLLGTCYLELGDYNKAIEAENLAMRYAHNNYVRGQVSQFRDAIHRKMNSSK